jgi:hypothetical protein
MQAVVCRWLLSLPECASAGEHQRADAVDSVCRALIPRPYQVVAVILVWMPIIFTSRYLAGVISPYLTFLPWLARNLVDVFIGFLLLGLFAVVVAWLLRHRAVALLRKRIIRLGIPLCRHCGYDLRGQIEPRCPECGRQFDARLPDAPGLPDEASR